MLASFGQNLRRLWVFVSSSEMNGLDDAIW
jgi:hypothetical protein